MNILCVIDSLGSGGAQRQLVNLAIAFKEKGHNIEFLVYHSDPFYYEILCEHKIKVIEVLGGSYIKRIFRMRRVIRKGNYDSVLSFLEVASFISTIAGFPYRKWNLTVGERSANPNINKSFKLKMYRWFHFFVTAVVANSQENIRIVEQNNSLLRKSKLHVIYNLIDLKKWEPNSNRYIYRKNGKFNLIVVSSHQYLKNLNGLVEAVNLLNENEREMLIINWYGGGSKDDSKIKALEKINEYHLNKNFIFYEPTLEISNKVNEADALGLFSFYEGLPNVICEAMVNSKAIISSNISDVSLFINDKFTFNPEKPQEIADKISLLLSLSEDDINCLGRVNRDLALKIFEKENIVNEYLEILGRGI